MILFNLLKAKIDFFLHLYWEEVLKPRLFLFFFFCAVLIYESDHIELVKALSNSPFYALAFFSVISFLLQLDAKNILFNANEIENFENTLLLPPPFKRLFIVIKLVIIELPLILYFSILGPKLLGLIFLSLLLVYFSIKMISGKKYGLSIPLIYLNSIPWIKLKHFVHTHPIMTSIVIVFQCFFIFLSFFLQNSYLEINKPRNFLFVFMMNFIIIFILKLKTFFNLEDESNSWFWTFIPLEKINHDRTHIYSFLILGSPAILYALIDFHHFSNVIFILLFSWFSYMIKYNKNYYYFCILGNLALSTLAEVLL